jgi:hypothetical protein
MSLCNEIFVSFQVGICTELISCGRIVIAPSVIVVGVEEAMTW